MHKQKYDIPFAKASITKLELKYANDAAKNGWGKNCYDYIDKFENKFSNFIGAKYAISTSSCTGAIHLALRALDLKENDEVIVPEVTWIATVAPITYEKAKIKFVNIDTKNWCMDINDLKKKITSKTKVIIVVHLYGNVCNLKEIKSLAKKNNIYLIEDAAESLGSKFYNKYTGSIGDIGVFSFHGTKTITTGEGGMLVCNNKKIYEKAYIQSNHGRVKSKHAQFWMDQVGVKYKLSNIQAAIGLAQLERIDEIIRKKRFIFNYYKTNLKEYPISMNIEEKNTFNSYWLPVVSAKGLIDEKERDKILKKANNLGIGLRPFFYPLAKFPMFKKFNCSKEAYQISSTAFNLPSYHDITESELNIVINEVKKYLEKNF